MKQQSKRHRLNQNIALIVVFLIGLTILLYPQISRIYYTIESNNQSKQFDREKSTLHQEDISQRIALAKAFNASLHDVNLKDPYSDDEKTKGRAEYARMLELHEQIGHVEIPKIRVDLPIYAGTSDEIISKGSGHLEGTSLPVGGENTHTVLTSHSGLPSAKLFSDLAKLKKGDIFYIHNIKEILAYQIDQIKIIEPDNFSDLLIVPGKDYATLLTCTPVGINTHRLIVRGHRVPYVSNEHKNNKQKASSGYMCYLFVLLALLTLLFGYWFYRQKKKKSQKVKREEFHAKE
ncbi:class C sortase [Streptococcus pyogenes]|uniref:class C sortase n=1 Tax=Streptococcus pyogenes TaxID=1314 RepID=UPI0010A1E2DE|nr:class C sortase [Streptococcus pyogenes]VGQ72131.1 Sortase [Streptococcus pyogenes]VHB99536.1 Sortase [Streptococcus pyogenes]VHC37154.1 Sortase [Streptococcus pyogenes]